MIKPVSLAFIALVGFSSSALAQYTGPSIDKNGLPSIASTAAVNIAVTDVRSLIATGKDDMNVTLQGRIVRHLGSDKYRFADATGEIDLEIDNKDWPAAMPIDDKTEVRIAGEFDKSASGKLEVEVDRIDKVR